MSLPYPAADQIVDSFIPQVLWLPGGHKPVFVPFIIAGGQNLVKGSVLGRITATNKLVLATAAAADGSQTPMAILGEDVSTFAADGVTALDMSMSVAVAGYVNVAALNFGAGINWLNAQAALAATGIYGRYMGYSG